MIIEIQILTSEESSSRDLEALEAVRVLLSEFGVEYKERIVRKKYSFNYADLTQSEVSDSIVYIIDKLNEDKRSYLHRDQWENPNASKSVKEIGFSTTSDITKKLNSAAAHFHSRRELFEWLIDNFGDELEAMAANQPTADRITVGLTPSYAKRVDALAKQFPKRANFMSALAELTEKIDFSGLHSAPHPPKK